MERQKTIKKEVRIKGIGIHTGKQANVCFKPAARDTGINFARVDLPAKPVIRASVANVMDTYLGLRRTSLGCGGAEIHTVEHLLSALFGLGIDNLMIEIDAEEIPAMDGAAAGFCKMLSDAGIEEIDAPKNAFVVREPVCVEENDAYIAVLPNDNLRISYTLSYADTCLNQYINIVMNSDTFLREIAPCKTFCFEKEVNLLRKKGLGQGASAENTIVVDSNGAVKGKQTFPDELTRHKVLDLIGDFSLLSPSIKAHIVAVKSGHSLNIKLLRKIEEMRQKHKAGAKMDSQNIVPPFDIEKIMQILPHRYPFLLVDKVLEFTDGESIVAAKNVTINEQFFTGHFPGRPVMPGVLIIEAMAQAAGILMLSRAENRGKLAYFMSMDKVKFRKTVVPGDVLVFKIKVIKIKSRTIIVRGEAFVEDKLAAEADMMFSLVPKNAEN
ncbi:MAG: bifunctional UDP-3-O-[3-hydroxymyristoyl] N-acetylglucosamine deacetylase/3-hydroxyacyl-ACP dehydratase [Candidatus Omnitrophota bacterium]